MRLTRPLRSGADAVHQATHAAPGRHETSSLASGKPQSARKLGECPPAPTGEGGIDRTVAAAYSPNRCTCSDSREPGSRAALAASRSSPLLPARFPHTPPERKQTRASALGIPAYWAHPLCPSPRPRPAPPQIVASAAVVAVAASNMSASNSSNSPRSPRPPTENSSSSALLVPRPPSADMPHESHRELDAQSRRMPTNTRRLTAEQNREPSHGLQACPPINAL